MIQIEILLNNICLLIYPGGNIMRCVTTRAASIWKMLWGTCNDLLDRTSTVALVV